ncbi:MAG: molybdenum cofactor guanylyltransferase MobA [Gammaproteobacteria bacterium]|jgi:molybdopterin-guanine dinucleotide biosynthesis protein A
MSNPDISCIILAGGKGRRMGGADKGLVQFKGRLLIAHVIENIAPQVDDIVISANRNLDQYKKLGYAVYADQSDDFDGPLAGIASTLPHCQHDWVLIIPCDMPSLPANLVASMVKAAASARLVVINAGGKHQLVFLLHRDLLGSIMHYLDSNEHSVMQWVDSVDHQKLDMAINNSFLNINKPEQLQH